MTEAAYEKLIEETEWKMLGIPRPGAINDMKIQPDKELAGGAAYRADRKAIRAFVLANGRAPGVDELRKLLRFK
jgi:hypothetical protein